MFCGWRRNSLARSKTVSLKILPKLDPGLTSQWAKKKLTCDFIRVLRILFVWFELNYVIVTINLEELFQCQCMHYIHIWVMNQNGWILLRPPPACNHGQFFYSVSLVQAEELEGPDLEILSQCNLSRWPCECLWKFYEIKSEIRLALEMFFEAQNYRSSTF